MSLIAGLPMYDFPEVRLLTDGLWSAIQAHLKAAGIEAPANLTRPADLMGFWRSPDLLLGQTCGYPLTRHLTDAVQVVATPHYTAPGCVGAWHCSVIVVAADSPVKSLADLRGKTAVINERGSNTGMNLLRASIAPYAEGRPFFGAVIESGGHAKSMEDVGEGRADVASLDCVTFAMMQRYRPEKAARVRVLAETPSTPALPLVTAARTPHGTVDALRAALMAAAADPELAVLREALFIDKFEVLPVEAYKRVVALEQGAEAAGYPVLV
ncbi:phosphate/phosphite/phosphonate ABC transporter substrate-binding protein [Lacibacterium aquatile]|uniref:Phosphate/phosphite/phosphonate ABC transporter substrate-binding protein n=1 Tax=Lacibacterium aquatile TaxID=1168082 RepID=A0ABW5DWR3_9PROT